MTSVFINTKTAFRLKQYKESTGIVKVVSLMMSSPKQNLQSMGVQIAGILYRENQTDVLFNNLMLTLSKSRYEVVRKKIIKTLRVPLELSDEVKGAVK